MLGPPLELTENRTETGPVCEVAPAKCVKVIPVAIPGEARGRCEPGELLFKSDKLLSIKKNNQKLVKNFLNLAM